MTCCVTGCVLVLTILFWQKKNNENIIPANVRQALDNPKIKPVVEKVEPVIRMFKNYYFNSGIFRLGPLLSNFLPVIAPLVEKIRPSVETAVEKVGPVLEPNAKQAIDKTRQLYRMMGCKYTFLFSR